MSHRWLISRSIRSWPISATSCARFTPCGRSSTSRAWNAAGTPGRSAQRSTRPGGSFALQRLPPPVTAVKRQLHSIRAGLWALEEKLWARRSWRRMQVLNATPSADIDEGTRRFGEDAHQVLYWFAPSTGTREDVPVVFFVHGGGWQSGDPAAYRFIGRRFAQRGWFACVVGYRVAPQFIFPAPL